MIERNASDGVLAKINMFYDDHSSRDSKGKPITFDPAKNGELCRKMTFRIPNHDNAFYTAREYLNARGAIEATEMTSMFIQDLYSHPEDFFKPEYNDYFKGMIQCLKKVK